MTGRKPDRDQPTSSSAASSALPAENPKLPAETTAFRPKPIRSPYMALTESQWLGALHGAELRDKLQQVRLRPWLAVGVFVLLLTQNIGIWFIIVWAIQTTELSQLQLIFSTLIAATLTQSYLILRYVVDKVFDDIDYHDGAPAQEQP